MEESKPMIDIRNKRLNYYNRIMEMNDQQQKHTIDNNIDKIDRSTKIIEKRNSLPDPSTVLSYSRKNLANESIQLNESSKLILEKIFGDKHKPGNKHSMSFDASSTNNSKLEEFKRVVEDSYTEHVLNKNENQSSHNSYRSSNQVYSKYLDTFINKNSDENTSRKQLKNDLMDNSSVNFSFINNNQERLADFNIDTIQNEETNNILFDKQTESSNSPCKIPYMSAYNIYESVNKESTNETFRILGDQQISQKKEPIGAIDLLKKPNYSSTGSSLTTSPTSISSSTSGDVGIKKLSTTNSDIESINQLIMSTLKKDTFNIPSLIKSENEPLESQRSSRANKIQLEAKPPETPRKNSSNLSYRKNLLVNKSNSLTTQSSNESKLENAHNFQTNNIENADSKQAQQAHSQSSAINLYSRSNSINEQMIRDQFTWESMFKEPIASPSIKKSFNSVSSVTFSKNRLQPIESFNKMQSTQNGSNNNSGSTKKQQLKTSNTSLDKFFNLTTNNRPKKFERQMTNKKMQASRKSKKNNIFNYLDDEDELDFKNYENNLEYDEDDDKCDTFDIFSSDEEPNANEKKNSNNYTNRIDLKIDLGQLSADEESLAVAPKNDNDNEDDGYDLNEIINSTNRTQQIKPDNIPNLCLDLMDDDKSQSVAASLAKSMCKEIDYKKEMEMLYKKPSSATTSSIIHNNFENGLIINQIPANTAKMSNNLNSSSYINLNKPTTSSVDGYVIYNNSINNKNSNINQEAKSQESDSYFFGAVKSSSRNGNIIKPVKLNSARPSSSNLFHKQTPSNKPQFQKKETSSPVSLIKRPNSVNDKYSRDKEARFSLTSSKSYVNFIDSNNKQLAAAASRIMKAFNENSISMRPPIESSATPTSVVRNGKLTNKKTHWNTSTSMNFRRSHSALSTLAPARKQSSTTTKSTVIDSKVINYEQQTQTTQYVNRPTLFLDYTRLIEIESKLQSEKDNNLLANTRPSSASVLRKSTIKFDLPQLEEIKQKVDENFDLYDSLNNEIINDKYEQEFIDDNKDAEVKLGDQEAYAKLMRNVVNEEKNYANAPMKDWLDLPDEIWLKIFTFLNQSDLRNVGCTCKAFNSIYLDESLWRSITMKYKENMQDDWLRWIGKRRPNELNIIQCNGNITLHAIVDMFKNIGDELKTLNLSRCSKEYLSGDNFALQASIRCKNVTSLDLSWTLLSNQTLKLIADSFIRIESINLSGCNMIQEDGFIFLLTKHGESLRNLEISGCLHFSSNCILNIGVYCRSLEKLNISNCHRMTNESLIEACPHWLKLKHLDLRGIKTIKNNCISILVRKCAHLEGLALADCVHIGDTSVLEIATYKQNIKYLDLNGCKKISDASLRSLSNFCSKLEYLNLKGTSVTDIGLITLSNGKFIKNLIEINLSFLPVSELVVMKLLGNSSKLKSIHLYGCYNIKHVNDLKKAFSDANNQIDNLAINI